VHAGLIVPWAADDCGRKRRGISAVAKRDSTRPKWGFGGQGRNRYFLYLWLPTVLTDQIVLTGNLACVPTVPTIKYKKNRRMSVNYGLLLGRSGGETSLKLLFLANRFLARPTLSSSGCELRAL